MSLVGMAESKFLFLRYLNAFISPPLLLHSGNIMCFILGSKLATWPTQFPEPGRNLVWNADLVFDLHFVGQQAQSLGSNYRAHKEDVIE